MPNHTIYIRKEDKAKWDIIDDKSAWVRERLNETIENKQNQLNHEFQMKHDELKSQLSSRVTISKPPELSDLRWLQHLKDNGIDLADTSVDTNPDWGA